jgi:hypothetical protein
VQKWHDEQAPFCPAGALGGKIWQAREKVKHFCDRQMIFSTTARSAENFEKSEIFWRENRKKMQFSC